jgi:colicin import membrane protein
METTADKTRAVLYAIGVHLACLALMFVGLLWTDQNKPISVAGSVIEATLVSSDLPASSAARPRPAPPKPAAEPEEAAPRPQPKPEPKPEDSPTPPKPAPQAPLPDPDVVEQEKAARLALQQAEEKAKREQEEKRRQEQVELDQQEQQQAEERERLRRMQEEQARQLADIRKKREEAERRRKLEEEKLQQLADASAQAEREVPQPAAAPDRPPADRIGNNGTDESLLGRYQVAIQQAVLQNWLRPDSARPGLECRLRIIQIPGGEVIQVSVTSPCNADDLTRRSIEAAVMKAQPLPYRGYESVFQRDILFKFRYDG